MPDAFTDTLDRLTAAMGDVHDGSLSPTRAQAIASLARALAVVWSTHVTEKRVTEIEDRLSAAGSHRRPSDELSPPP